MGLCIVMAFILCSVFSNRENCLRLHDLLGSIICWFSRSFSVTRYDCGLSIMMPLSAYSGSHPTCLMGMND